MRARDGWAAAALAAAMLHAASGQAQESRECDGGRGVLMPDLGFRSMHHAAGAGSEPRLHGVRADGPAAGLLRDGDLLVAVDGKRITAPEGRRRLSAIGRGERVRLSVRRGSRVEEVTVVAGLRCIGLAPDAPPAPDAPAVPAPPQDELMPEGWLGFTIRCDSCGDDEGGFRFGQPPVVSSVEAGSPAARAGLRPGDGLTHVDGIPLTGAAGWPRFSAIRPGDEVSFTYTRAGQPRQATLPAQRRR